MPALAVTITRGTHKRATLVVIGLLFFDALSIALHARLMQCASLLWHIRPSECAFVTRYYVETAYSIFQYMDQKYSPIILQERQKGRPTPPYNRLLYLINLLR